MNQYNDTRQFGDRVEDFRSGASDGCSGLLSHSVAWILLSLLFVAALLPFVNDQAATVFGDNPTTILIGKCILFAGLAYVIIPDCVMNEQR